jgi:glycosyltransferase 2 family protein
VITTVARLTVGAALLVAIVLRVDWSRMDVRWGVGTILTLLAAVAVQLVAQALSAERWRLIMGSGAPRWSYLFRLYLIGNFFSIFLPTSIGGDAIRVVAVAPSAGGKVRGGVGILLDRLFGVAALGCYLVAGLLVGGAELTALGDAHLRWPGWVVALVVAGGVALALVAGLIVRRRFSRLREVWGGGWELVQSLGRQPGRLIAVAVTSFLVQGAYIVAWMVLGVGLGLHIPLALYLVCVPIVSLGAMLPITFSGLGIREGAWLLLLASLGIPKPTVVVFSLMYFAAFVVVGAVGGLAFLVRGVRDPSLIVGIS